MPFRWTINPYRGCSHACLYCLAGDTPILMADGRTRLLAHLSPGDRIVGHRSARAVSPLRRPRRCSRTGRRSSRRIASTLEDGTELIASGDHRFLTNRGGSSSRARTGPGPASAPDDATTSCWARVASPRRPSESTTTGADTSAGSSAATGTSARTPTRAPTAARGVRTASAWRLRDDEALQRADALPRRRGRGDAGASPFHEATAHQRAARAIRTSAARQRRARSCELIALAAVAQRRLAQGLPGRASSTPRARCGGEALRIANTDHADPRLDRARACAHFGFDRVEETAQRPTASRASALRGGLRERLRFFHLTDPAITPQAHGRRGWR